MDRNMPTDNWRPKLRFSILIDGSNQAWWLGFNIYCIGGFQFSIENIYRLAFLDARDSPRYQGQYKPCEPRYYKNNILRNLDVWKKYMMHRHRTFNLLVNLIISQTLWGICFLLKLQITFVTKAILTEAIQYQPRPAHDWIPGSHLRRQRSRSRQHQARHASDVWRCCTIPGDRRSTFTL